jgi:hypothetical protein
LKDTAAEFGFVVKTVKTPKVNGHYMKVEVAGEVLNVSLLRSFQHRWVGYQFNGKANTNAFQDKLVLLEAATLCDVMVNGRVKAFELALDMASLASTDYIVHRVGSKTSHVVSNEAGTGKSLYLGSRRSDLQHISYDKAQEQIDKGMSSSFKKLWRIEARMRDPARSLVALLIDLQVRDPFQTVQVVPRTTALSHNSSISAWPLFVQTCMEVGVPRALRQFPAHKKSFLAILAHLADDQFKPSIERFDGAIERLLPPNLLAHALQPSLEEMFLPNQQGVTQ